SVLFGSILSISSSRAYFAVAVGVVVIAGIVVMARPLLFASVDEAVAAARGVRVRTIGVAFLVLAGACAAETTQAVGALLLLGLLAAPAGAALRLSPRPYRALWLSAALAVAAMWIGLAVSRAAPRVPPSFAIVAVASAFYALSFLAVPRRSGSSASM
ncbi:MAG: metal ABC transporter permease, partial [Acidimicrobiia bacterium]|nr:metal ABC transporter permease [Acidimicrobiia bacterium]